MTFMSTHPPAVVCPPGADPLVTVLRHLEGVVEGRGWDGPTAMFWLHQRPLGIEVAEPPMPDSLGRSYPVSLLDELGPKLFDPAKFRSLPPHLRRGLYGFVVTFEGWAITAIPTNAASVRDARAAAAERRIFKRPDRVEVRQATLATLDGQEAHLIRIRSQEPVVPDSGRGGAVPAALRRFVALAVAATRRP